MNTSVEETNEITAEAIRILFREIGVAKTLRFLSQVSGGHGDYTKEKQDADDNRTVAEIVAEIKKQREKLVRE
ncbi:MAG TPA: hypothetical protein VK892_08190 [Pyrinomonadaceae bacterium]|nr:hypothetical protein [Pyrinomonadaceae bacterium]